MICTKEIKSPCGVCTVVLLYAHLSCPTAAPSSVRVQIGFFFLRNHHKSPWLGWNRCLYICEHKYPSIHFVCHLCSWGWWVCWSPHIKEIFLELLELYFEVIRGFKNGARCLFCSIWTRVWMWLVVNSEQSDSYTVWGCVYTVRRTVRNWSAAH